MLTTPIPDGTNLATTNTAGGQVPLNSLTDATGLTPINPATSENIAALAASTLAVTGPLTDTQLAARALATQATSAAILAKLSADPATQTTLAAILAKIIAAPATESTLGSLLTAAQAAAPAGENHIGQVTTPGFLVNGATFTRPADTTAYASGDLVANSTTAGSVVPISLSIARIAGGTGRIYWIKLFASNTSVTNAQFRVHFYSATPVPSNGDNGAWLTPSLVSSVANYLGSADVVLNKVFTDGAEGEGYATIGSAIPFKAGAGVLTCFALIEARSAYTPTSAQTFTLSVGGDQD